MFTGIIKETGLIKSKKTERASGIKLEISSKKISPDLGDSVSVNGVCLTVVEKTAAGFWADVVPETLARTNLGELKPGDKVNLEESLRLGDKISGHFVFGHVDAAARVISIGKMRGGAAVTIELPKHLAPFIAEKGSVAINGVCLTVASAEQKKFTIALIPFTRKNTALNDLRPGDKANIEVDMIARYLYNFKSALA